MSFDQLGPSSSGDSVMGKLRKLVAAGNAKSPIALTKEIKQLSSEVAELRAKVAELQKATQFDPPYTSTEFTERFRGSRAEVVTNMRGIVPVFAGVHGPIVDVGQPPAPGDAVGRGHPIRRQRG